MYHSIFVEGTESLTLTEQGAGLFFGIILGITFVLLLTFIFRKPLRRRIGRMRTEAELDSLTVIHGCMDKAGSYEDKSLQSPFAFRMFV